MRISATLVLLLWITVACAPATAETLSATLAAEDASSLAQAAREKGDGVRGAILFSQKKLGCAGCHQSGAGDLLGPDLATIGADVKATHLIEAILQPSKTIKEGFGSVTVLTIDGRALVGRVIDDRENEMVLRDASEARRLIRLPKEEIEQSRTNDVSTMPIGLADQLADRQQFLDLIKYLLEIAASDQRDHPASETGGGEVSSRIKGLALIDRFRCTHCHPGDTGSAVPAARAPVLSAAAARIAPDYLRRFIADPSQVKPGTSMPDVMGHLDGESREAAADAIQVYLASLTDADFQRHAADSEAASRGNELFHTVGCVACHSPRASDGEELLLSESLPLGNLTAKYSMTKLVEFLENPHLVRPSGRMPDMKLSHWEAVDLANYLLLGSDHEASAGRLNLDGSLVETGRKAFAKQGCANCHEPESTDASGLSIPLAKLNSSRGCLSLEPDRAVRFELTPTQRSQLAVALERLAEPLHDTEKIRLSMQTFRCFSCHQRDELGGVADARDHYFHSENENLGPQGRIPPTLTNVGAKLNPKWLRQVLVSGRTLRPYIKTRMPQYGTPNVVHMIDLLAGTDRLPDFEAGELSDSKEAKRLGAELVGQGGLNCVACHTFQKKPAQTMPAVDLTEMAERLQRNWFEHYMRHPQTLSPGTVMPSFWPGGKAIRKDVLHGDTDQQIAAIWEYLLDGRQARTPRGLALEPIEVLAGEEAVMLRRQYPGIGKRGIGVGYPGQVNLAFDAERIRLAMIWRGGFADMGGVWRGQGSGNVRPLSRQVLRFPPGPDLDDAETPWAVDDGRPPRHQFTGYSLDQLRRPKFTYRFDGIAVEDYTINLKNADGSVGLRRTISLSTRMPKEDLAFRLGSGERIEQIDERTYRLDDALEIAIHGNHLAEVKEAAEGNHLWVPLSLDAGTSELVIDYSW